MASTGPTGLWSTIAPASADTPVAMPNARLDAHRVRTRERQRGLVRATALIAGTVLDEMIERQKVPTKATPKATTCRGMR